MGKKNNKNYIFGDIVSKPGRFAVRDFLAKNNTFKNMILLLQILKMHPTVLDLPKKITKEF